MSISRRGLILQGTAGMGLMTLLEQALAAPASAPAKGTSNNDKLIETAGACIKTGLICTSHCQKELAQGNKSMAECLQSVLETVAACEALQKMASYNSTYTRSLAQLTAKICADCAKLCEKHATHMEICKACMEACKDCEKACLAA